MQADELRDDARAGILDAGDHGIVLRHAADLPANQQVGAGSLRAGLLRGATPGSTDIGHGVAINHDRWRQPQSARAVLPRLATTPIDSGVIDGHAIGLWCLLAVPAHHTRQHSMLPAERAERAARRCEPDFRSGLRAAVCTHARLARMRAWRPAAATGTGDNNALPSPSFPADPA